ncbi:MAG: hypothetical protein OXF79_16985 [Chloroflexi bacterium]|nr:hypothetical protein [Chloroflexota bacterium]
MAITEQQVKGVKEIVLNGAKRHFPPGVQFEDATVSVMLNREEEEFLNVELLYTAPDPLLDGQLMNTLFRVIDEPILASGVTAHVMVHYIYANDPTWQKSRKSPTSPITKQ